MATGVSAETYVAWAAYQQSRLAAILFSNELNRQFSRAGSGATSLAVAESDKWFYMPQLLLEEDKEELMKGPATSIAALAPLPAIAQGGLYLVDSSVQTPSEHATREDDAAQLWEYSMALEH